MDFILLLRLLALCIQVTHLSFSALIISLLIKLEKFWFSHDVKFSLMMVFLLFEYRWALSLTLYLYVINYFYQAVSCDCLLQSINRKLLSPLRLQAHPNEVSFPWNVFKWNSTWGFVNPPFQRIILIIEALVSFLLKNDDCDSSPQESIPSSKTH